MKINIAYRQGELEEEKNAEIIQSFLKELCPDARTHFSDRHAPYLHVYLTTTDRVKRNKTDKSR